MGFRLFISKSRIYSDDWIENYKKGGEEMKDLGIIVGNDIDDAACLSVCYYGGWTFTHNHC